MPIEVTMPRLSDTMEQGTVVSWNVAEGDEVSAGDVLGDIETDKATMELQNFDDGVVAAILLGEGETVEVGRTILVLAEEGEDAAEVKENAMAGAAAGGGEDSSGGGGGGGGSGGGDGGGSEGGGSGGAEAEAEPEPEEEGEPDAFAEAASMGDRGGRDVTGRVFASPLAKKIAKEMGVDLNSVKGTGPSGRIVKKDVEGAASRNGAAKGGGSARDRGGESLPSPKRDESAPSPLAVGEGAGLNNEHVKLNNMRATIARRLKESKSEYPHYYVTVKVSMDELLKLRKQLNEQLADQGVKLTVNDFLVRGAALAMSKHPFVNASWGEDGQSIELHGRVNIGVAIALSERREGGLVVATIRDADRVGLRAISQETKRLAKKARDKGLTIDEMADASFTISNLGMYGVEHYTAIINPPNAAILAVGAAEEKPVVRDGAIVVGHEMRMTLSSDHRVIDGAMAADYLQTLKGYLEKPASLLV